MAEKPKVALVLSGGGARGIAHIGVIEELLNQGYEISSIAGTSMGSVVGAAYAVGKMKEYKEWLFSLDKMKVFNLVDFTLSKQGFIKGDRVLKKMRDFIPDCNIEDLDIPFAAVSADIMNKKQVVFTEGNVYDAIRASVSIPTIFTPIKTRNTLLVDGGVMNNMPLDHVTRSEGDILVGVNVSAEIDVDKELSIEENIEEEDQNRYQKKITEFYEQVKKMIPFGNEDALDLGYFDLINKTIDLMMYHMTQEQIEKHKPDVLIEISSEVCGTFDFYRAHELVEIGRKAAVRGLQT